MRRWRRRLALTTFFLVAPTVTDLNFPWTEPYYPRARWEPATRTWTELRSPTELELIWRWVWSRP